METNCSDSDMMKVLNKSLILVPYPDNKNEQQVYFSKTLVSVTRLSHECNRSTSTQSKSRQVTCTMCRHMHQMQ